MKQALVYLDDKTKTVAARVEDNAPVPTPSPTQVLIKVEVSGSNPKDWKIPVMQSLSSDKGQNSGDDIAGYVEKVGSEVTEFKHGDRVAAFHRMMTPSGSFAEYAIAESKTTFHLPIKTSFEEASTIPLAAMTAVVGLFARLGLPERWSSQNRTQAKLDGTNKGVIVYGGASAVGAFAIKLLQWANIHPIITIAGKGTEFVESLIDKSKGDVVLDYRKGDDDLVRQLEDVVSKNGGKKPFYAFDAVSEKGSHINIAKVLDPHGGRITQVLPVKTVKDEIGKEMESTQTSVGSVHGKPDDLKDLGFAWFRIFSLGLSEGWLTGHPYQVIPGGLEGVETGLKNLQAGKASATKYIFKIDETPGLE